MKCEKSFYLIFLNKFSQIDPKLLHICFKWDLIFKQLVKRHLDAILRPKVRSFTFCIYHNLYVVLYGYMSYFGSWLIKACYYKKTVGLVTHKHANFL